MPTNPDARAALLEALDLRPGDNHPAATSWDTVNLWLVHACRRHLRTVLDDAAAVRAAREECAQVAERAITGGRAWTAEQEVASGCAIEIAKAIRALSDAEPGGDS